MSFWHCEIILFFHYSIFCCYILQILRLNYLCWSMEHSFLNLLLNWFINSFLPNSLYVVGILLWEFLYFICQVFIPGLYACFIKWFGWQSLFFIKKKKVESLEKLTGKIIFPECVSEKILRQLQVFHEI